MRPSPHRRRIIKGVLLLATLVAIAYLYQWTGIGAKLNKSWIDHEIRGNGLWGQLLFLGLGALVTAVGFPRQPVSFLAGYAFGFLPGSALRVVATTAGALMAFLYGRCFGRALLPSSFAPRLHRVNGLLHNHPFTTALMIRLLPVGNNLLTNLAAGISRVRLIPYFLGSALGFWPQTAVFALIGSGINVNPLLRIGLGVVLFVISGVLGNHLYRRGSQGWHLFVDCPPRVASGS